MSTDHDQPDGATADSEEPRRELVWAAAVGDEDFVLGTGNQRCVARNRTGRRCGRAANKGMDPPLCHFHGGAAWRRWCRDTGRYAELLQRDEQTLTTFEQFLMDPDICDVSSELALQRTMLASVLAKIDDARNNGKGGLAGLSPESLAAITAMNVSVARLAEAKVTIDRRREKVVSVQQLHFFIEQVTAIISDVVRDPDQLNEIATRLDGVVLPQPRAIPTVQGHGPRNYR